MSEIAAQLEAANKPATAAAPEVVVMEDGRSVTFAGKRRMIKEVIIDKP